jgi:hypothetical protein
MNEVRPGGQAEELHCAICGRGLTDEDLKEILGGGLLLCGHCRAQEESCGCRDEADEDE